MTAQRKIPTLRFPEFEGELKFKLLGQVASVTTGNKDTKNKIKDGIYPFYVRSDNIERINSYSYDGEAILTSGDGVGVGKNFHYINGKFDYHQRVYCIYDFSNEITGKFLYQYFANAFYKRVIRLSAKNSVDSVRMSMITDMQLPLPSLPEQQKIADFLTAVDERIQQLTKKKKLLEQYKKGVMQQIFSRQIRFKTDEGNDYPDWEEKRLGDVFSAIRGNGLSWGVVQADGENECILYGELYTTYSEVIQDVVSRTNENTNIKSNIGDLLIPCSTTTTGIDLANVTEIKKAGVLLGGDITILRSSIKIFSTFYAYYLTHFKKYEIAKYAQGSTIVHLSYNHIKVIDISIPSFNEQQKIADFLTGIDDKITIVNTQIEQTQQFKKGLLQQMFV